MPAPAPVPAVRRPPLSVWLAAPAAPWAAVLACAALAGWGVLADRPLLAAVPGVGLGLVLGVLAGRRAVAQAAAALVQAPTAGPAATDDTDDATTTALPAGGMAAATLPELRPLAEGIRALVDRQQALYAVQAEQLEALRRQAHTDPLTGLANRRHFMALLDNLLGDGLAPADAGLLLLRLRDLQGLNQRVGHAATDRALRAVAGSLQTYPDRIGRCCAGRLNGADFALLLPVGGMAQETASALTQAMRLPLLAIDPQARVFAGAVELDRPMTATRALALADAALARAEADLLQPGLLPVELAPLDTALPLGESSWQRRISRALAQGRVALGAYPVRTPDGRQLHLDCPLRVQLQSGGPLEPASRWLSLATRSRLCAEVDEKAVALALAAIEADGRARCINVAAQSVGSAEFVAAVARRLEQAPQAACRLWIDLPEALALERPLLVREVSRRWRPLGAMLGLEHAGDGLARIPRLIDLGLDCVRIDGRFVNGISGPGADDARRHLQGLVKLVQAVGLQVTAEGVRHADDLDALWQLGFDAATGPALAAEPVAAHAAEQAPVTVS